MKIEEKEKVVKLYYTEDGKEFLSKEKAEDYMKNVFNRKKDIKYFKVTYGPDLTEGRGYHRSLVVAVERSYSHNLILEHFCEKYIGSRVGWVMGVSPMPNWSISESKEEHFLSPDEQFVYHGDYRKKAKQIFLSNSDKPIEGYSNHIKTPYKEHEKYESLGEKTIEEILKER